MSDNTTLNSTSGGDIIRTLDRSGTKTQVAVLDVGGSSAESVLTATAKGTQGTVGVPIQELKDGGRNSVLYYNAPVNGATGDALMTLIGYKSGAAVTGTPTPAVVSAGKTFRITMITITSNGTSPATSNLFTLRCNLSGVVAIGSPAVCQWIVGAPAAVVGVVNTIDIQFPAGLEFPAGAGIGISVQGRAAAPTGTSASGFCVITISGFEY